MRTMLKARAGSIVNISSVVGVQSNAGQANYAASKAGILGFTKSVALELGNRNIRCNAIAPGFIETEMTAKLDEDTVKVADAIPLKRAARRRTWPTCASSWRATLTRTSPKPQRGWGMITA